MIINFLQTTMIIDDTIIIAGFGTGYLAMASVIGVLWAKVNKLEAEKNELQEQIGLHQSATQLLERCPSPTCPLREPDNDNPPPLNGPSKTTARIFPRARSA